MSTRPMPDADANIPWIDVETTGLSAQNDYLLEIACIVTDSQLNVLDKKGYHAIVWYHEKAVETMRAEAHPVVQDMHDKTGLWGKLNSGKHLNQIDAELFGYLRQFGRKGMMPVAGNTVRLDMNFIDEHLPKTAGHLGYQMRDVTTVAKLAQAWYPDLPEYEKFSDHTAMTDIKESIRELKHYRDEVFRPVSETELDRRVLLTMKLCGKLLNVKLEGSTPQDAAAAATAAMVRRILRGELNEKDLEL